MDITRTLSKGASVLLVLVLGSVATADVPAAIVWQRSLGVAQSQARTQNKLVLDFLLIGNLDASDC